MDAFADGGDIGVGPVVVDVLHAETHDLDAAHAHAQLEMHDELLQGCLLALQEDAGLLRRQPVHLGAAVLGPTDVNRVQGVVTEMAAEFF